MQAHVTTGFIGAHPGRWLYTGRVVSRDRSNPFFHDKSDNQYCTAGPGCSEDREVHYQNGASTKQRDMAFSTGLDYATIRDQNFISYYPSEFDRNGNIVRRPHADFTTGTVDAKCQDPPVYIRRV